MKTRLQISLLFLFITSSTYAVSLLDPCRATQAKINLNTATISALTHSFPGIAAKRAAAIIRYRETHGRFRSIQDLGKVKGLGKGFIRAHLAQLQKVYTVG